MLEDESPIRVLSSPDPRHPLREILPAMWDLLKYEL